MNTILIAQRKQRLVWATVTALIALLGLAQRDQRALLAGPDAPMTQSAFAAITPQSPGMAMAYGGRRGGMDTRGSNGRSARTGSPQFVTPVGAGTPAGTSPSVFDQPGATDQTSTPTALLALADPAGGSINAGPSVSLASIPTTSPGGPQQTVGGSDPGAVPEAPIWVMLILGVGGIGCMMRRERARGRQLIGARQAA